ncbi:MAG: HlyD family efflux transporter periplasmic adaptor subunit [Alphaproteobacteria bacterium]|nr:HlyD family efflux transporter periplasmic adaptor subunit [Alphaproteobacteria bacterium]
MSNQLAPAPEVSPQQEPPTLIEQGRAAVPSVIYPRALPAPRRPVSPMVFVAVVLLLAAAAGYWWLHSAPALPAGFALGNGRLEADAIDIDTKFAGRVAELLVDEGDQVKKGQVVAVMDSRDLQAQLKQSQEVVLQAQHALQQARENYTQQQTVVRLAAQEVERTSYLVPRGYATQEALDQRKQQLDSAAASLNGATAAVGAAEHAADAATHQVELYQVNIADNSLTAPKDGPIEYRVANVGEVLPAGGKVFTMLDASYLYMDIYLPTAEAGRIRIGSEARIVLDAYPGHVIPANIVFIASQAQFTPKTVETTSERDKLMFRIRVRIDPDRLKGREAMVRSGLPGVAYARIDSSAVWPANLQPSPPPAVSETAPSPASAAAVANASR